MKSFLTACGLVDSLQLVIESQLAEEGELRLLEQPFALIGRDQRADLVLDHARVSRRHVYLQVMDGQAFWVDLESRTGTHTDGEFRKSGWLEEGRPLCVGPFAIRRLLGDDPTGNAPSQAKIPRLDPLISAGDTHAPLPEVALEFLNGPVRAMAWPVRRVMSLIGSASGCKFRLTDASVSRFHGSLLRTSSGLWIVDLLSQGGITVNEVAVRFSHLADGDLLKIGRYQIRVRCQSGRRALSSETSSRALAKPVLETPHGQALNGLTLADWNKFVPGSDVATSSRFTSAVQAVSTLSKASLTGSEPAFPFNLAASESTESILVPLVNQFGLMQQQMFDQFQQAMAMMVQMFGTMHRDQMALIREELDRLRDLTEEFHALKEEMASRTQARNGSVSNEPIVIPPKPSRAPATEPKISEKATVSEHSRVLNAARGNASSANRSPAVASEVQGQQATQSPRLASQVPQAASPELTEPEGRSKLQSNGTGISVDSERDSIVWLHQRIIALQQERETRWQKILKLLPGAS